MTGQDLSDAADDWSAILEPGERVIWQGQPSNALRSEFRKTGDAVFAAALCAVPMLSLFGPQKPNGIFILIPIAFLAAGLYQLVFQHFWQAHVRSNTHYSLTNKRAFIASAVMGRRKLASFPITAETPLTLDEGPARAVWFARRLGPSGRRAVGFEMLDNPPEVYDKLRAVQEGRP